jgi:hypothetical protein
MLRLPFAVKFLSDRPLYVPVARVHLARTASAAGTASSFFRIDTGADFTVLPISYAPRIGFSENEVRRTGRLRRATVANGETCDSYCVDVHLKLETGDGGWMEWVGEVGLQDSERAKCLLGVEGFLSFFERVTFRQFRAPDGRQTGGCTELEPRQPHPGEWIQWSYGQRR